jgi:hypothetical protein
MIPSGVLVCLPFKILCVLCALCGSNFIPPASAQSLRSFARPVEVFEGDAVVFTYRTDLAGIVPLSQIHSWRWDFNNDGQWDEEKTVGDPDPQTGLPITASRISTTWYATYDPNAATNNVQQVLPKLEVTYDAGSGTQTLTKVGMTENVVGPDTVEEALIIKDRSVGNADLSLSFSANPRLSQTGDTVRVYSSITPVTGITITPTSYLWTLTNQSGGASPAAQMVANPQFTGLAVGSYDVTLALTYTAGFTNAQGQPATRSGNLTETKRDYLRVVSVSQPLQLGRAYRRGFPDTFGWQDIMNAYQALGPGNNRYVYFNHFENAFFAQENAMVTEADKADPAKRKAMVEIVNEMLQGQILVANQRLIDALRIKYPRLSANIDPDEDRLNPPAGTRTETSAIDQALLDYQLPIRFAAQALQKYDSDILRVKAPTGAEPYPQFPQYLTFEDPTLSQAPIPIKNEYWQLTTTFERMCLGRMEKAKKLYRLSAQDSTALAEAKEEAKVTGLHSYLGKAMLVSGQSEQDYQLNEGNNLLAHQKNARDLFERINAGVNPLGNDGSFIPNESFSAIYQDATEAVADAREAEINARQEERLWDSYQAELRNEHLAQRNNYLTPLKNLTSSMPSPRTALI